MLTVDCSDIIPIKHDLMIFVADKVKAVPSAKIKKFTLSPIEEEKIDEQIVIKSIQEYLNSIKELEKFNVVLENSIILIKSKDGNEINRDTPNVTEVRTSYYTWESPFRN